MLAMQIWILGSHSTFLESVVSIGLYSTTLRINLVTWLWMLGTMVSVWTDQPRLIHRRWLLAKGQVCSRIFKLKSSIAGGHGGCGTIKVYDSSWWCPLGPPLLAKHTWKWLFSSVVQEASWRRVKGLRQRQGRRNKRECCSPLPSRGLKKHTCGVGVVELPISLLVRDGSEGEGSRGVSNLPTHL